MPTEFHGPSRRLPDRANLRHLRDQAKDLHRSGKTQTLADAQVQIARRYGFANWPKLKAQVQSREEIAQLKRAIDNNDIERIRII